MMKSIILETLLKKLLVFISNLNRLISLLCFVFKLCNKGVSLLCKMSSTYNPQLNLIKSKLSQFLITQFTREQKKITREHNCLSKRKRQIKIKNNDCPLLNSSLKYESSFYIARTTTIIGIVNFNSSIKFESSFYIVRTTTIIGIVI